MSYNPIKKPLLKKKKKIKSHFCRKIWKKICTGSSPYNVISEIPQIV